MAGKQMEPSFKPKILLKEKDDSFERKSLNSGWLRSGPETDFEGDCQFMHSAMFIQHLLCARH